MYSDPDGDIALEAALTYTLYAVGGMIVSYCAGKIAEITITHVMESSTDSVILPSITPKPKVLQKDNSNETPLPPIIFDEDLDDSSDTPELPDIDYPGDDPTVAPDGYEWRGPGEPGSKQGNYYNDTNGRRSLSPDLGHEPPIGPHWDYTGPEGKFRIFPDGNILLK